MTEKRETGNPHATAAENARFAGFAASLARGGFSPSTCACYASDWWTISEYAERATGRRFRLDRFRPEDFQLQRAELAARGSAPATLNRRLAFLRRYSAFAAAREPALAEVAKGFVSVPFQSVPRRTVTAVNRKDENRLRAAADALGPQEAAIVALLLGTGLRASEAAALVRSDVSIPPSGPAAVRVRGPRAKTVLVAPRSQERLAALLGSVPGRPGDPLFRGRSGGALGEDGIVTVVEQVARDAGVEATPRTLRHTFGVRYLSEHRDDLDGLARALGHTSLAAARAYREEAAAGAPSARVVQWNELAETEPAAGVRRRAFGAARLSAERELLAPGFRGAPRAHPEEQVTFVLSGVVTFHVGGRRLEAGAGGIVHVPAGVVHSIEAARERTALVLHVCSPPRAAPVRGDA